MAVVESPRRCTAWEPDEHAISGPEQGAVAEAAPVQGTTPGPCKSDSGPARPPTRLCPTSPLTVCSISNSCTASCWEIQTFTVLLSPSCFSSFPSLCSKIPCGLVCTNSMVGPGNILGGLSRLEKVIAFPRLWSLSVFQSLS